MTNDTQKARECYCGKPLASDSNYCEEHEFDEDYCPDCHHSPHLELCRFADAESEIFHKDAEIADLRTAFNKFALNVMVAAIEGIADAAIVKQATYTEHTSLDAVRTLAKKHKSLRAQAEKDKAENNRLREILIASMNVVGYASSDVSVDFLANLPTELTAKKVATDARIAKLEETLKEIANSTSCTVNASRLKSKIARAALPPSTDTKGA